MRYKTREGAEEVLPVGVALGPHFSAPHDAAEAPGIVRRGAAFWRLPLPGYELWEQVGRVEDITGLEAWAAERLIDDLHDCLDWFKEQALLVAFTGDFARDRRHLASHRLLPLAFGAGNTPSRPDEYRLVTGSSADPTAVDATLYLAWSYCDGRRSILMVIEALAERLHMPAEETYAESAAGFAKLVRARCLAVDAVIS